MKHIESYIKAKGYACRAGLVESYYLSLKSRPFVFLCGKSATDMTVLPRLFADAIGAPCLCLKVQPDWMDSSDLFGHLDLEGNFVPGAIIDYLKQAQRAPEMPHFLCFEGVLLDRAEYFLREILASVESRETDTPLPLVTLAYYGRDEQAAARYGVIPSLGNLYIICTVNMDEASRPINQKLLDRVHTMAFEEDAMCRAGEAQAVAPTRRTNDFLQTVYARLDQCDRQQLLPYFAEFENLNKLLMKANAYMGYRQRNDGALYLMHAKQAQLSEERALDHVIAHKILTRVQGNAKTVRPVLEALLEMCAAYPYTTAKLKTMLTQCQTDGYAGFWE